MHITPNGKVYIGMTCRKPAYRWCGGRGYRTNKHFYRAIVKYGWNNIQHKILYSGLNEKDAKEKEIELIREYKSSDINFGYNKTLGGDCRCKQSPEAIEKIKRKITGTKRTPEQIEHYKLGARKRPKRERLSKEHKEKISRSLIGNKRAVGNTAGCKPVFQYGIDGALIKRYESAKEASIESGCDHSSICKCCRENEMTDIEHTKYKGLYKGYRWCFEKRNADYLGGVNRCE